MSIQERLQKIKADIQTHAAGREVTLVAVTKYATVEQMRMAYDVGLRNFGENKVQDALEKMAHFPEADYPDLKWHFIGNLQTNKARKTVGRFHLIHAVDSGRQAEVLSRINLEEGKRQEILLQINLSADESRHGLLPDQASSVVAEVLGLEGIALRGLMGMAPPEASLSGDLSSLKGVFGGLAALRDRLADEFGIPLPDLSMGMSHDYVPALESGATIIRIGNYLFQNA